MGCPKSYSQSLTHFDTGMVAFEKENYNEAAQEFSISLTEDQDNIGSRFYYALALYYSDKLSESRSEFVKVAQKAKDSPWGQSALSYVEAIDLGMFAPLPEKDFEGYFNLAYDSDDNVNLSPSFVAEGTDTRTSSQLSLVYKPTLFSYKPVSFSINGYGSQYYKNTSYNSSGGSTDISLYTPFILDSFFSMYYGSGINYLKYDPYYISDYYEGRLTLNFFSDSLAWTSVYYSGSKDLYRMTTYEPFDASNRTVGIRQNLNSLMYLQYENKALITRGDDYAYRSDEFSLSATAPFMFLHKFTITGTYINKNFIYDDSLAKQIRHDTAWVIDLNVIKDITRYLAFSLKYLITNNTSTLDKTQTALGYGSYLEHVVSLSFSYKF
jgi:hypothetical protein